MDPNDYLLQLEARLEPSGFERLSLELPNLGCLRVDRRSSVVDNLPWTTVCVVLHGPPGLTLPLLAQTSFTVYDTVSTAFPRPVWSHLVVYPLLLMPVVPDELAAAIRGEFRLRSHLNGVEFPVLVDLARGRIHYAESGFLNNILLARHRREARELFSFPAGAELAGGLAAAPEEPVVPATAPLLFVSYRREDSADATGRLCDRLAESFGRETIFRDVDSIPLGVDFRQHIEEKVGACQALLAVIGRQWLTGEPGRRRLDDPADYVRIEIESALHRGIPVIPVLVGGAWIPAAEELPESLREIVFRNGIPVRPDPDFHGDVDRLIRSLSGLLQGSTAG